MRIINDGLPKEDIKWVRDFLKDYDTKNLTIIFTSDWRARYAVGKKKFIWRAMGRRVGQYNGQQHASFLYGVGGHRNLPTPLILVKIGAKMDWKSIFLHEFGHYLDDKMTHLEGSRKRQEQVANDFADVLKAKFESKEELIELYERDRKMSEGVTVDLTTGGSC